MNIFYIFDLLSRGRSRHQELASAAGVPLVSAAGHQCLHQCVGNGMIIPNVGMVVLSVLASLSPSSKFKAGRSKNERYIIVCSRCFAKSCLSVWSIHARAYPLKDKMKACYQSRFLQGLPASLKYHSGWKKWKLDIGDQIHTFSSREDALMAHKLVLEHEEKSSTKTVKQLNAELSAAGIKPERTKDKAVQAAVRLGFRQNDTVVCTCCAPKKAKDIPASHSWAESFCILCTEFLLFKRIIAFIAFVVLCLQNPSNVCVVGLIGTLTNFAHLWCGMHK